MTYTTQLLSESINGELITVDGINTANSVLAHTAVNVVGSFDEINLFANNNSGTEATITIEIAGDTTNTVVRKIPAKSTKLVLEGLILDTGKTIKAFATVANVINLFGNVGRTS